ncbi:Response regulator receiver modulated FAD-dependent pyridine nucleotide-disulfide oxidoreductase [Hyella patelloides LEGE 07179]|uniref:Response regulator receiver modulated FAD-dependent pyridine nucleotide-disulfide oxidoreductase n=1 Tax=Hyella patelloides LEGE 07179 TaxID=945734 RepID=A0A563VN79_9CYAN|nr:FAD-dependent oxidoreductase [Hyella patelloides]VEP12881.1 Response regulator receiver modulated FAD-dependent pyridine nucleotide-disulfide oxidoreductase [Hyella patelloides LEGE 07179]
MTKPAIVTIDDDAEVLRTITRDLRLHYGSSFRIIPHWSSTQILETLQELKERQHHVALFLVDQRMPQMTGVEFLERAREMFPEAKRALITAYADSKAAMDAINKAKVDYYLLKPWLPAHVHLYPVLDDLLEVWQDNSFSTIFEGVQVFGYRWSPKTHKVKDFLARHHIPYIWRDLEQETSATKLGSKNDLNCSKLPLLIFPDDSQLESPSILNIAEKVGLKTDAEMPFYDLVIIGGGPAGLASAVYGSSEGLKTVLIEKEAPGGQAGTSSRIENYLGFPVGLTGADLARRAVAQAYKFGTEILTPQEVTEISTEGQYRIVTLANGKKLNCHALIVATGVSYIKLQVPGIERLTGAGVYYGAAITEAISCNDNDVFIIGGANSAGQGAMCLSKYAKTVTLLVRGDSLQNKMSQYLVDQIEDTDNIKVRLSTKIIEASGENKLESITIANSKTGKVETVPAQALFIFIGAKPNTKWLQDFVLRDRAGFILTGSDLMPDLQGTESWTVKREPFLFEASVPGVFAIGDVRYQSVKRVASAVGEGSVAVRFIHQYLASF